jgi:BASS family bile acid:Na+ symporter
MLMDLLNKVATTALLGFVVSSTMAMGVGFTIQQIIDALRDVRLVLLALLANFVAIPLGALALEKVLRLDEPLGVGLLLLGAAAGAPCDAVCPLPPPRLFSYRQTPLRGRRPI